jgi:hypothetical protein
MLTLAYILADHVIYIDVVELQGSAPLPKHHKETDRFIYFLVSAVVFLMLVSLAVGTFLRWRMLNRKRYIEIPDYMSKKAMDNFEGKKTTHDEANCLDFLEDSKLNRIDPSEVQFGSVIGSGGFGVVFNATYKNMGVAAKSINVMEDEIFISFLKEIKLLSSVDHPNIVKFIGIVVPEDRSKVFLLTELMDW